MFINFWYPVERADKVSDEPMKKRMLGLDFVVFRDTRGVARCLANTCCHRGASLAGGKIRGDCVQCPYHGWEFDGDGICQKIPSMGPGAKIPKRARVDSYPTRERYGLVFAFLGDLPEPERPPIMAIEEYGAEGWTATVQEFEWPIDYKRSMENGIDPGHNEFVHDTHGFSGERDDYKVGPLDMRETEWGTGFYNKVFAPPLADKRMREESEREEGTYIDTGTGHHGISSIWTHIHPSPKMFLHQYLFETPIDESNTHMFLVNLRNFLPDPENNERFMQRNAYVADQDKEVLKDLLPVLTPNTNVNEIFVPADHPVGRFREHVKDWEARGWRIDKKTLRETRSEVAYAIPSPARREIKGWVLEPVPLLQSAG